MLTEAKLPIAAERHLKNHPSAWHHRFIQSYSQAMLTSECMALFLNTHFLDIWAEQIAMPPYSAYLEPA